MDEKVNHPTHYQGNNYEVIDIIEDFSLGFNLGNSIKYILRSDKKGSKIEDLRKAVWYLEREIQGQLNRPKEIKILGCAMSNSTPREVIES